MGRKAIDRKTVFKMFALNWDKKKVKREAKVSERSYWMLKKEFEELSGSEKEQIKKEATVEEKAKAKFEDYEFVQTWIARMQSDRIKGWKSRFRSCQRIWKILQKKNPENWTEDDIKIRAIPKLRERCPKSIFHYLIALRSLRPDLKEKVKTKREKAPINIAWRYAFKDIVQKGLMEEFFSSARYIGEERLDFECELIVRLHVTLGCREGTKGQGGIINLEWSRVDWRNKTMDVFESKTGGGFFWQDCPLTLFGGKTFEMLKEWHKMNGEPVEGKIFPNLVYDTRFQKADGELVLAKIYKNIRDHFKGKIPKAEVIKPHFARKLHASLLKKAGVPLEIVSGEAPHGIVGVGWEDLSTLKKFYISFAEDEIQKALDKAETIQL